MERVMTVNESMVLMKIVRGRLGELSSLRQANSSRETSYYGSDKKVIEPMYDVKALDKKCTELENFLLIVETKIKQSNAITKIKVDAADVSELLAPIS
jgi:hypothetical protein